MSPYLKLYWFFGALALIASCALAYCLSKISPWALYAAALAIAFRVLVWLQEEMWNEHRAWKALTQHFAAHGEAKQESK